MRRLLIAIVLILGIGTPLTARGTKICEDDSIDEVAGDGAIVTMLSGFIWKVDEMDRIDSSLWLGTEDVLICSESVVFQGKPLSFYTILNKDESGEEVHARKIGTK